MATVLEGLARQNASGALAIDGTPSGLIYLDRGHITFARSSWSPDLGTRLSGLLPPGEELPDLLHSAGRTDASPGDLLVGRGLVGPEELRDTLESVIVDAVIVLTVPLAETASVTDIRLETPRRHWAQAFCRLGVDTVRAQALSRAERMARHEVPRSARLELRDLTAPAAVLSQAQWAVASQVNGSLTTWDLAWRCGLALCDTFEAIGGLAAAGLCEACPEPAPDPGSRPRSDLGAAGEPAGPDAMAAGGTELGDPADQAAAARSAAPPLESLRRVLDGLRRLS